MQFNECPGQWMIGCNGRLLVNITWPIVIRMKRQALHHCPQWTCMATLQRTNWKVTRCIAVNRPHIVTVAMAPPFNATSSDKLLLIITDYCPDLERETNVREWLQLMHVQRRATTIDSPARFCRGDGTDIFLVDWCVDTHYCSLSYSVEDPTCPDIIISGWLITI